MYSTVANQKRKSGEKKRHELETEAGGYGGSGGNRGQRRGDGKANRSEQLRGKEGTTCFAVSLTPAIIHRERPFISCWTWRMERERERENSVLLGSWQLC